MTEALLQSYTAAQTIFFTDERIKPRYVEYDSPGGSSGKICGYFGEACRERSIILNRFPTQARII